MTSTSIEEAQELYGIILPNGDKAEAEDLGGALLAAFTLTEEASVGYGIARQVRREVIVTRGGMYDGLATEMARNGQLR